MSIKDEEKPLQSTDLPVEITDAENALNCFCIPRSIAQLFQETICPFT